VRLYSRPGNDLTYRFPLIVEFHSSPALLVFLPTQGLRSPTTTLAD
jgi:hypothetical protein